MWTFIVTSHGSYVTCQFRDAKDAAKAYRDILDAKRQGTDQIVEVHYEGGKTMVVVDTVTLVSIWDEADPAREALTRDARIEKALEEKRIEQAVALALSNSPGFSTKRD